MTSTVNHAGSPLGAELTLAELDTDPYAALARLREREPVSWVPVLDGWLVTRRDLCIEVMRDAALFTVDDPRFSTAQVVGPSMLSLDGDEHRRHRDPFARAFLGPDARAALRRSGRTQARTLVERADARRPCRDPPRPCRSAGRQRGRRCAGAARRDADGRCSAGTTRSSRRWTGSPRVVRSGRRPMRRSMRSIVTWTPRSTAAPVRCRPRRAPVAPRDRVERRGDAVRRDRDQGRHDDHPVLAPADQPRRSSRPCAPTGRSARRPSRSRSASNRRRHGWTATRPRTSSWPARRSGVGTWSSCR